MNMRNYEINEDDWMIPTRKRKFTRIFNSASRRHSDLRVIVMRYILVQGKKRKIKVLFMDQISRMFDAVIVQRAAKIADEKGWSKVAICIDFCAGDRLEAFNMHQFHHSYKHQDIGIFLSMCPT